MSKLPKLDTPEAVLDLLMNGQFQGYENERDWLPIATHIAECVRLRHVCQEQVKLGSKQRSFNAAYFLAEAVRGRGLN